MKILSSFVLAVGILLWNVDALDLHRFFWSGYHQHQKPQEEIRVIEIVRWHQPICVKPGKGVSSCLHSLRTGQQANVPSQGKEELSSGSKSNEEEEVLREFVASEMFASSFPLRSSLDTDEESASESGKRTEVLTGRRDARYLVPHLDKTTKPKQIYVTKVLNAPFTATLVAQNCLPDIGVPLCVSDNEKDAAEEASKSMQSSLSISVIGKKGEGATNSFSVKSVAGSSSGRADVENPDSGQASSTSLGLDYTTTQAPDSPRIAPSNLQPETRSNVSNFETRTDDQFAPTELILESSKEGVVEESSVTTKIP